MRCLASRCCEGTFNAPTVAVNALTDGGGVDSGNLNPLSDRARLVLKSKQPTCSAVAGLLGSCNPAAVLRLIVAVIVDTLNRMFRRRTLTHVGQKAFKFTPSFTNLNSALSVGLEVRRIGVSTSINHQSPNAINRRSAVAVRSRTLRGDHSTETPATCRFASSQANAQDCFDGSTITSANPMGLSANVRRPFHNQQPSESLPDHVLEVVSHGGFSITQLTAQSRCYFDR